MFVMHVDGNHQCNIKPPLRPPCRSEVMVWQVDCVRVRLEAQTNTKCQGDVRYSERACRTSKYTWCPFFNGSSKFVSCKPMVKVLLGACKVMSHPQFLPIRNSWQHVFVTHGTNPHATLLTISVLTLRLANIPVGSPSCAIAADIRHLTRTSASNTNTNTGVDERPRQGSQRVKKKEQKQLNTEIR